MINQQIFSRIKLCWSLLVYLNQDNETQIYYLPKGSIDNYNVIINEKKLDQPTDSDVKRSEEIRKLTTGQGEDYTPGCLLDYDYIKNHYRLLAVDLSRQKNEMLIQKQFSKQNYNYKILMIIMMMINQCLF